MKKRRKTSKKLDETKNYEELLAKALDGILTNCIVSLVPYKENEEIEAILKEIGPLTEMPDHQKATLI